MCDGIPSLAEVTAIAALAQCIVTWFDELIDAGAEVPLRRPGRCARTSGGRRATAWTRG